MQAHEMMPEDGDALDIKITRKDLSMYTVTNGPITLGRVNVRSAEKVRYEANFSRRVGQPLEEETAGSFAEAVGAIVKTWIEKVEP